MDGVVKNAPDRISTTLTKDSLIEEYMLTGSQKLLKGLSKENV